MAYTISQNFLRFNSEVPIWPNRDGFRDDRGGYHLVWPRDLVQCATALLAVGAEQEVRNTLRYLIATQKQDGSWYQNQWLGGTPYWQGLQLDEVAFPVLLAASMAEREALNGIAVTDMIHRALCFIAATGPSSPQDRLEENAGINTFTISVCIAALVAGAEFLPEPAKDIALALADFWNDRIESWTAVRGSPLARRLGVEGYYIRVAPPDVLGDPASLRNVLNLKNRRQNAAVPADEEISIDFLQLVRFGLRSANDPLIRDSIAVADALLKVDTPAGPAWHGYNGDGYGEHNDGRPFDGTGRGRAWPLLAGERGHYELIAGNDPTPHLKAMAAMAGPGGMMPEQTLLRLGLCISPNYASLNFEGSPDSVHDTGKFDQNTVAHCFDNAAMMRLDSRIYEFGTNVA